ncbi:amyloid-beta-like protein isoform X2 [Drosophila bipectinata]|uniref:amyloid-beta-like protein isoform X2 n=1 Tax=Drosophila bipectinata TaxID=42026 RepID=UPI001C898662|nr:amyloid-beta-like protein isoform X2 [Drosophila bipectinata]
MCAALRRNLLLRSLWVVLAIGTAQVQAASPRWEPQIAVLCEAGQVYQPQYLSEEGRWVTDLTKKTTGATCLRDKMDLLDYCKKAYPTRDITNIVESSHYQKIGGWCRQGALNAAKCKGSHRWIKPFRCLGPFQSDALLVPEGCLFDHIHNASRCWPFVRWNQTGAAACQERGMQMRSFAMLLPCGISVFSGVEFVCCPKHFKTDEIHVKKTDLPVMPPAQITSANDDLMVNDEDESNESNYSKDGNDDDLDDEDDLMGDDEEDEMVADEAAAGGGSAGGNAGSSGDANSGSLDDINAEYDSGEEGDNYEEDGAGSEGESDGGDTWDQSGAGAKPVANLKVSGGSSTADKVPLKSDTPVTSTPQLSVAAAAAANAGSGSGSAGLPPSTAQPTSDPYFTHFDPHYEHQSYKVSQKEAQQRLEESHREKVTRVMKDWSDLEEKYQDMRLADPKAAQSFKQRMTARFQTSVQALEEEGNAEKHQLAAMHQQRVLAHINQRKREAMTCYTQALTEQPPNAHHVEKCLQKLLRALHKDRAHALAHYRHLLNSGGPGGLEAAASERPRTLERLIDIDRAVNQSMTMLKRYPELSAKIAQLMNDYILALRSKDDIPGSSLGMSEEAEAGILDKYRVEIERKVAEKERLRLAEKQRKEQRAAEREKLREEKLRMEAKKVDDMLKSQAAEQQQQQSQAPSQTPASSAASIQSSSQSQQEKSLSSKEVGLDGGVVTAANLNLETTKSEKELSDTEYAEATVSSTKVQTVLPTVDDDAVQRAVEDVAAAVAHQEAEPQVQHFMTHDLGHRESSFSLRREFSHNAHAPKEGRNVYFTLSFAGIALMAAVFVGVAVAKWRTSRSPHAQGFIEVDQNVTTHHPIVQEEKIVPNMQINGYENPTYKYFEVKE